MGNFTWRSLFREQTGLQSNKLLLFLWLLTFALSASAGDYNLTFTGSGASTIVDKVLIENTTKGTKLTINGSDILVLSPTGHVGNLDLKTNQNSNMTIYPNPANGSSTLTFNLPETGNVNLTIYDISGKVISQYNSFLESGIQSFQLPTIQSGLYLVSATGKGYHGVTKLMSSGQILTGVGMIVLNSQKTDDVSIRKLKSSAATLDKADNPTPIKKNMIYANGDRLKITGTSGLCQTILMDSIAKDKNIDFFFINCFDADGNAYPVTKIGPLYWMTENLRTTKYNSGLALNQINSQVNWTALTSLSEAYCYYNDATSNGVLFGALYTFNAATANITPTGWRLPSQAEFNEMVVYLGGNTIAGGKLKTTGTNYWTTPNNGATNETGYNALATSYRTKTGFSQSGSAAAYWTSNKADALASYSTLLEYNKASVNISQVNAKQNGLSIRCVFQTPDIRTSMMKSIFGKDAEPKTPVVGIDTLPIPKKSFLMPADKELMFMIPTDVTPFKLNYNPTKAATSNIPNIIPAATTGGIKWWLNLKKMTTQLNDNGHENTIIAVWNETKQGFSSGPGKVTLHIIGDSLSNYAHQTVVLPDDFTMPDIIGAGNGNASYNGVARYNVAVIEYFQHELNIKTGDVNNDGIPDILIGVHDMLRIYDGKTFEKIAERSFQSDHNLSANQAFYLCFAVTDIDKNGRNDILVTTSSNLSNNLPQMHLFVNGNLATTDANLHIKKEINAGGSVLLRAASFAVGDINGDGVDEIVFHLTADTRAQYVSYCNYSNKSFTSLSPLFAIEWNEFSTGSIILAHLKGPAAPYYIVTSNCVIGINNTGNLCYPFTGSNYLTGDVRLQVLGDQMVAGNFDKSIDGVDKVCYIFTSYFCGVSGCNSIDGNLYLNYMYIGSDNAVKNVSSPTVFRANYTNMNPMLSFPVLAAVNTSHTGKILEFKRHEYMLTSPVIDAVLAGPPYYADWFTGSNGPSTTWGTSTSSGSGTETEITHSASVIMGFEQEFNIPLIATKVGGVEFTAKVSAGFSSAFSSEKTVTKSIAYQSQEVNAVVVTATPYDAYFYKVIKSDKPDQEGSEFMISFPRKPISQMISADTYNQYTEGQNVPVINEKILKHIIGQPLTYPTSSVGLSNLTGSNNFLIEGTKFVGVGNTGGVSQEIEISETQAKSTALSIEVEAELVFTVGGAKLGAGYGFDNTNKNTTTIGKSTKVGGYVPGLKAEAPSDNYRFNWNLVWYNYRAANQTFSIVNYLVKEQ